MDEMLVVCKAVRRGVKRALVSCDFPFGPLQQGAESAVAAAIRLVKEAGADMIKLDAAADFPETVRAAGPRRHSGLRAVRHHAADRAANTAFPTARSRGPARRRRRK